eukprot:127414_1
MVDLHASFTLAISSCTKQHRRSRFSSGESEGKKHKSRERPNQIRVFDEKVVTMDTNDEELQNSVNLRQIIRKYVQNLIGIDNKREAIKDEDNTTDPSYEFMYILGDFVLYLKEESDKMD